MKKIACIIAKAPYGQRTLRDAVDVVMACAVFDRAPALFFIDDGVCALLKQQQPEGIQQKNIASMLQSLPLFDVSCINVCQSSMEKRGIQFDDLVLSPMGFDRCELAMLLNEYSILLTF